MWNSASDLESLGAAIISVMSCDISCNNYVTETASDEPRYVAYEQAKSLVDKRDVHQENGLIAASCNSDKNPTRKEYSGKDRDRSKANQNPTMVRNSIAPGASLGILTSECKAVNETDEGVLIKSIFCVSREEQGLKGEEEWTEDEKRAFEELASQMKRYHAFRMTESNEKDDGSIRKGIEEESLTRSLFSVGSSVNFLQNISEETDLGLVEEYDNAFNEFLRQNPEFFRDQDRMQKVRIAKLQNLLDAQENKEATYINALNETSEAKLHMVLSWQDRLRAAARKKASRETHLQSYLGDIHYKTKTMEAQLTWQLIRDIEQLIKKKYLELQELRQELDHGDNLDRLELLKLLDGDDNFDAIRDAALAPSGKGLSVEQRKDLNQFQVDNEFLLNELLIMRKKLVQQRTAAKKHTWVESALIRMDERSLKSLKNRFRKRAGVPICS